MSKTKKPRATRDSAEDAPTQVIETKTTAYDGIRENLEAIVVAFILALVIRHFAVEAFEIPTGSMAPTLYGIHAWIECPNCEDFEFNAGLSSDTESGKSLWAPVDYGVYRGSCPKCQEHQVRTFDANRLPATAFGVECSSGDCNATWQGNPGDLTVEKLLVKGRMGGPPVMRFQCPNCEYRFRDVVQKGSRTGGHKILVNKMRYKVGDPQRWDVIVFQFSEKRNYIKRLLGLPGETVYIQGGDLCVKKPGEDEFRVQGKTERPDVRDALWFKINDSDIVERGLNPVPAWDELHKKGSALTPDASKWWTWKEGSWTVNVPNTGIAILEYNRECQSTYNYNSLTPDSRRSTRYEVGDKKVEFTVHPTKENSAGSAWIGGEIRDGEFTYQFRVPIGEPGSGDKATLFRLPNQVRSAYPDPGRQPQRDMAAERVVADVALPSLRSSHVAFWNADDRVAVEIDGEEVLAIDYVSGSPEIRHRSEHYGQILASNIMADFQSIQVYRDIYYTYPGMGSYAGPKSPLRVPSEEIDGHNGYFPCGDNSPSSSDGRFWGTAPEKNMMGRAFFIFWPAWPTNFQCGLIR